MTPAAPRERRSPAVSGGQIFIRTARYLYCIGKPAGPRR